MMTKKPSVSLLVAMRDEEKYIERCLTSILAQDYPAGALEIWVLDGSSTDGSRSIAERVLAGRPGAHVISNPRVIQSEAWNLGISRSTGAVIGIVSAHAELGPHYVSAAVETLLRTGATMVGGPMRAIGETPVARAVAVATSSRFGIGGARFHYMRSEGPVDTVYMGLCRRETYARLGGFDPEMVRNQDDEFSYRLLAAGGRIVCNPAIESRYYNRATLRCLWRQYFSYGYWKTRVIQRHPGEMRLRQMVPPVFVATLLLTGATSFLSPSRWALGGVIVLYALAHLGALASGARGLRAREAALLPAVFAILHLSYGLGFWKGVSDLTPLHKRAPSTSRTAEGPVVHM
jgi:succinoglycan biosynthesis protein ExoA